MSSALRITPSKRIRWYARMNVSLVVPTDRNSIPVARVTRRRASVRSGRTGEARPGRVDRVGDRVARVPSDGRATDPFQEPERAVDLRPDGRRGGRQRRGWRGGRGRDRRRRGAGRGARSRGRRGPAGATGRRARRGRSPGGTRGRTPRTAAAERVPLVRPRGQVEGRQVERRGSLRHAGSVGKAQPGAEGPTACAVSPRRSRPGRARWRSRRGVPPRRERRRACASPPRRAPGPRRGARRDRAGRDRARPRRRRRPLPSALGRRAPARTSPAPPRTTSSCSFVSSRQTATRRSPRLATISREQRVHPPRRLEEHDRPRIVPERLQPSGAIAGTPRQEALEHEPIGREPGQDEGGDRGRRARDHADVDAALHRELHDPVARDPRCSASPRP